MVLRFSKILVIIWRKDRNPAGFWKYHHSIRCEILPKYSAPGIHRRSWGHVKARLQVHTQGFSQLEVDVTISHKTDIFCLSFSEKDLHVKLSWFYFSSGHWFLFIFCDFPIRKPIFWSSFLTDFRTKRMPRSGLRFFSKKEIHVDFLDRINRKSSKFCII